MRTFSYTKSQFLIQQLEKIDVLRKELLTTPLPPKDDIIFRWQATVERILNTLLLSGENITRENIIKVLDPISGHKLDKQGQEITGIKRALDQLYYDWFVSAKTVTSDNLISIYQTIYKTTPQINTTELQDSLRYIQSNPDNPIVQSAIAQILVLTNNFFGRENTQVAHLIGLLFLYKYGFHFRQMLVLEEYFFKYKDHYHRLITQTLRDNNVTPWIEFVAEASQEQLTKLLQRISTKDYQGDESRSILELNVRQKSVLSLLDQPGSKISNKMVQKQFRISAITAARDLAKLTSLGLLFPIGRGRSTFYTKV